MRHWQRILPECTCPSLQNPSLIWIIKKNSTTKFKLLICTWNWGKPGPVHSVWNLMWSVGIKSAWKVLVWYKKVNSWLMWDVKQYWLFLSDNDFRAKALGTIPLVSCQCPLFGPAEALWLTVTIYFNENFEIYETLDLRINAKFTLWRIKPLL